MTNKNKIKKQNYGLTLNPNIVEKFKRIAKDNNRSFSYYVNQILEQELKRRKEK